MPGYLSSVLIPRVVVLHLLRSECLFIRPSSNLDNDISNSFFSCNFIQVWMNGCLMECPAVVARKLPASEMN